MRTRTKALSHKALWGCFKGQTNKTLGFEPIPVNPQRGHCLLLRGFVPLCETSLRLRHGFAGCFKEQANKRPGETHRANFTEVLLLPILREQFKFINPWLEDDQVEDVVKQLTAIFPGSCTPSEGRKRLEFCP